MKKAPEQYRIRTGQFGSDDSYGNNGAFFIPFRTYEFFVVVSDQLGWDHVSVSLKHRCPNWEEMCYFKNLFWDKEDCVIQYHPPNSVYVNDGVYVLHMWKPQNEKIPMPPIEFV